jgi:hypothetical protein
MTFRLLACGDNIGNKMVQDTVTGSATFQECWTSRYFDARDVVQLCGDSYLAVLLNSGVIHMFGCPPLVDTCPIISITATPKYLYGLDPNRNLRQINTSSFLFGKDELLSFAASSRFIAVITLPGNCSVAAIPHGLSKPRVIGADCQAVGCTAAFVFAATRGGAIVWSPSASTTIPTATTVIAIACSEDDAYFIDEVGTLLRFAGGQICPVHGLPPVVAASASIQHAAAIAADGSLFVWGYNPSGQLGIGSDRSVGHPKRVLTNVHLVACGVQNTWVLQGPGTPARPAGCKIRKPQEHGAVECLPFADRLLL